MFITFIISGTYIARTKRITEAIWKKIFDPFPKQVCVAVISTWLHSTLYSPFYNDLGVCILSFVALQADRLLFFSRPLTQKVRLTGIECRMRNKVKGGRWWPNFTLYRTKFHYVRFFRMLVRNFPTFFSSEVHTIK